MQALRKNMERMAEVVPASNVQSLHHFLSNSRWDVDGVLDQVAKLADRLLGGGEDSGLLIDESAFAKKGEKSVGVARQWNGRLGKVDNCQVAVFACLVRGFFSALISVRLYLPKLWAEDNARCEAAGVPEDQRVYRSKSELALEMVQKAREQGLGFAWVGADAGYGKEPMFPRHLEDAGEVFVVDVHKDQRIFLEDPEPIVPSRTSPRGQAPRRLVAQSEPVRVDVWAREQPSQAWQRMSLRHSTQGEIQVETLHRFVWLWNGREQQARCWRLFVTRELHSPQTLKYSLSNAPEEVSVRRLAQRQRQRFWIERSFQDAKSESGMADYQVRGWLGWHHHMALVMMAMLFMLEVRLENQPAYPLLSCADIEWLLAHFLPRKDATIEEVMRQMEDRHRARWGGIESAYRKRGAEPPSLRAWGVS